MGPLLLLLALACSPAEVPDQTVSLDTLQMDRDGGIYRQGEEAFSGYATRYDPGGFLRERVAFLDGRRHGDREQWYADGTLSAVTHYQHNRRDGISRTYWKDGALRSESQFEDGVAHGTQRQWYKDGAIFKEIQLELGREQGLQRAWRPNGELYNNYEAKNGRTFGLRRSKLCFELSEEEVISAK